MRWPIMCAGLFGASVLVLAQPLFTADDLDDSMKGVGRQFELVNWAVSAGDYEGAKVRVTRAREQLSATISFWRNSERADAVTMVRAATRRFDELDGVLSVLTIDADAVAAAVGDVRAACEACHSVYREHDPATDTYRLKSGVLP